MLNVPPRRILLATDLSSRCDRALDRAAQLAADWKAELVVVHALEWTSLLPEEELNQPSWRRDRDRRTAVAERQIQYDLLDHKVPFRVVIEEADPADLVLETARALDCDLIVTGTARGETFGRLILGATVDRVARRSPVPVLVVKSRVHGQYAKVMVATDFSDESLVAFHRAKGLFPTAAMVLLHCFRPVGGTLPRAGDGDQAAQADMTQFLNATGLSAERRKQMDVLIEPGPIETVVAAYAADKGLDLVVIGSRGRGAVATLLLGSTAETLLKSSPCDILIDRAADLPASSVK